MSGRRRERPQKKRLGKPRTLRARLVVASVVLIAVVCAVIGTVTTLALRSHLYEQLDKQLGEVSSRVYMGGKPPGAGDKEAGAGTLPKVTPTNQTVDLEEFVKHGPQPKGTIIAQIQNSSITDAKIGEDDENSTDISRMSAKDISDSAKDVLNSVSQDGDEHTVELPGLGEYRVVFKNTDSGSDYYVAIPTSEVNNTLNTLIAVEASVTAAGLIAAGIAGTVIVGVATRPPVSYTHLTLPTKRIV